MGSFPGHALPGSFFLIFSTWWTIQITRRYVACKVKGVPFYNTITYPCFCGCITFPVEGVVKLVVTSIGMVAEGISSARPLISGRAGRMGDYHGIWIGDIQHVTMYSMFFISGVYDILANRKCTLVPRGMDYLSMALAFAAEGLLFLFHTDGKPPLEVTLHILLLYAIACSCLSCIVEYKLQGSVFAGYCRAFFVFLQGTWFWQAGFILYPPFPWLSHWDSNNHDNLMLATAVFTWHWVAVITVMSVIAGLTYYLSTRVCPVMQGSKEYKWTGADVGGTAVIEANRTLQQIQIISSSEGEDEETMFNNT